MHDLLFSKRGIAAPSAHKLRVAVEKNKARLQAELTKARLRRKCATLDELKSQVVSASLSASSTAGDRGSQLGHARWVRINRMKTSLEEQLTSTFAKYDRIDDLESILSCRSQSQSEKRLYVDKHIPDLLALPPDADLSKERAYLEGKVIIQDKASCFPAYLLDPRPEDGIVVDGCAAPGNKTTHLASIRYSISNNTEDCRIVACERDKARAGILHKMVKIAGAEPLVTIKSGQDFLRADPNSAPWSEVGALLLDPSCSGSGIIGRDEQTEAVVLPSMPLNAVTPSKKRKRGTADAPVAEATPKAETVEDTAEEKIEESVTKERLGNLHAFQKKLVLHALAFPNARKITYSTCSIHDEENEHVVAAVLDSKIAKERGWTILRRKDQVDGMRRWHLRGRVSQTDNLQVSAEVAEGCIRCEKHTADGTQGFFVAGFVRTQPATAIGSDVEDEWSGFDD